MANVHELLNIRGLGGTWIYAAKYLVFIHLLLSEDMFVLLNKMVLLLLLLLLPMSCQLLFVLLREGHHVELSCELIQSRSRHILSVDEVIAALECHAISPFAHCNFS